MRALWRGSMTWIDQIEVGDADGKLGEMYAALIAKRGKVSNILKAHSLNPDAMGNHLGLYMTLMFGRSELRRAEREAVAVVVSATSSIALFLASGSLFRPWKCLATATSK